LIVLSEEWNTSCINFKLQAVQDGLTIFFYQK
jgi:hypothetical protein